MTGANLGRKQCRVGAVKISQIPAGAGWEWTKIFNRRRTLVARLKKDEKMYGIFYRRILDA